MDDGESERVRRRRPLEPRSRWLTSGIAVRQRAACGSCAVREHLSFGRLLRRLLPCLPVDESRRVCVCGGSDTRICTCILIITRSLCSRSGEGCSIDVFRLRIEDFRIAHAHDRFEIFIQTTCLRTIGHTSDRFDLLPIELQTQIKKYPKH